MTSTSVAASIVAPETAAPGVALEDGASSLRTPHLTPIALRALAGVFDVLIVALAFLGATAIMTPNMADIDALPLRLPFVCLAMGIGLTLQGAYQLGRIRNGHQVMTRLTLGAITGLGLIGLESYVLPGIRIDRGVFLVHGALTVPMLLLWRRFLFHTLREAALRPRAIVLGDAALARKVAHALSSARFCGAEVVGVLTPDDPSAASEGAGSDIPRLGGYERLREVCGWYGIEQAIVVGGPHDTRLPVNDIIALRQAGLSVENGPTAYEAVTGKLLIEKLTPGWLVFANAFERTRAVELVRRALAVIASATALILLAPFLAVVAALIKLDSRGPVFFRQERVGEGGKPFELVKFRTMRQDAEAASGPVWAQRNDPRVTRLGRFLRSTRIDELPQLWNVLRGDMDFVGPRPERQHFVELLAREVPHFNQRHTVKPGITGWAQINYRYGATIADSVEKLHFDLFYIQNRSVLLDLYIVLGTIRVMLGASNQN